MVSYFHRKSRCKSSSKKSSHSTQKTDLIQLNEIDHLLDESKETDDIMHNLALISNKLNKVVKKSYCCQKYQIISLKLLILDLEKHQISSDVGSHTSQPVYENRGIKENNNTKKGIKENKNRKKTQM